MTENNAVEVCGPVDCGLTLREVQLRLMNAIGPKCGELTGGRTADYMRWIPSAKVPGGGWWALVIPNDDPLWPAKATAMYPASWSTPAKFHDPSHLARCYEVELKRRAAKVTA